MMKNASSNDVPDDDSNRLAMWLCLMLRGDRSDVRDFFVVVVVVEGLIWLQNVDFMASIGLALLAWQSEQNPPHWIWIQWDRQPRHGRHFETSLSASVTFWWQPFAKHFAIILVIFGPCKNRNEILWFSYNFRHKKLYGTMAVDRSVFNFFIGWIGKCQ